MTDEQEYRDLINDWLDDDAELRIPDNDWGRSLYNALRALLASSAPATVSEGAAEACADCEPWREVPGAEPNWTCGSCGRDHVTEPATGVTSSDGYKVAMDLATGDITVSQWTPTSSDGDRGLSEDEWRDIWTATEGGEWSDEQWAQIRANQGRDGLIGWERRVKAAVEQILAARTAQPEGVEAYEDALRAVAAAAVTARTRVSGFHMAPGAGEELLTRVESALSALIALGYVPPAPDRSRRPLLAHEPPRPL